MRLTEAGTQLPTVKRPAATRGSGDQARSLFERSEFFSPTETAGC